VSDRLFVATRKGLFRFERRSAAAWECARESFLGDPVSAVLVDPRDGAVYAALALGHFGAKLHRSVDGGDRFEEIATPAFLPKPEGSDDPMAWNVHQVWALEAGGADEPGVLWAGTVGAGLFRSRDGAQSWGLVRSLWDRPERRAWMQAGAGYPEAGIHSICVHPRASASVMVAVSIGGVWATDDGGGTWECRAKGMRADYMPPAQAHDPNVQDVHRLVQCQRNPDVLWAQHHNGIWRTSDAAGSWQEVTGVAPSAFGFAVAVHPRDPNTAWFVPAVKDECRVPVGARFVVTRTRDGGRSVETLRRGLPTDPSYDLVYRHGLAVDATGQRLAMGSTTGNLWVSDDQGELWRPLSANLPPIYAVRFA
jgi:hypothetical protein